eukprot:scaffold33272_cov19-Tisochrysis_lutea.AAC.4
MHAQGLARLHACVQGVMRNMWRHVHVCVCTAHCAGCTHRVHMWRNMWWRHACIGCVNMLACMCVQGVTQHVEACYPGPLIRHELTFLSQYLEEPKRWVGHAKRRRLGGSYVKNAEIFRTLFFTL